jgi:hypothetical protein
MMKYKDVDWSSWIDIPSQEIYEDWLVVRKAKMTQTAITRTAPHINKLYQAGIDANEAMGIAIEKEWRGIKYQWVMNAASQNMDGLADFKPAQLEQSTRNISMQQMLTDDSWAE